MNDLRPAKPVAPRRGRLNLPPVVWILIAVVLLGFIALRLQRGQALQAQVERQAAGVRGQ